MLADPKRTMISVLSKSFKEEDLPELEPWYNINFKAEKYAGELETMLAKPQVNESGKKLDLPPPNNLIPSNFDVLPEMPEHSKQPVFAKQWDDTDLWFKKDDRFLKPKGHIGCRIYTNDL
jgi:secreted Zn-dependent insulinase-like peptidase